MIWQDVYGQDTFDLLEARRIEWVDAFHRSSFVEGIGEVCMGHQQGSNDTVHGPHTGRTHTTHSQRAAP